MSRRAARPPQTPPLPPAQDWRTTDEQELLRRQARAREERHRITNLHPAETVFSNFAIQSPSGMTYQAEIRSLAPRQFSCTCTDFRINGLGTCKHLEAVLLHLKHRHRADLAAASAAPSPRIDIVPDRELDRLRVERNLAALPAGLRARFDGAGVQGNENEPEEMLAELRGARVPGLRISQDVQPWLDARNLTRDRFLARRDYETGVAEGRHPEHVTLSPLFPYQREGMLHLAFTGRAMLADEMGLGKTIQAIAACALLRHLGKARRVLVVTPASLKTEWEEQITRFTKLPLRLVFGGRGSRVRQYAEPEPPFFTIANYEQIVPDSLDINAKLRPDIVILDEAQRIKNWSTKTAQAVKRLQSPFAFVLTGTPIENRIDELRSLIDFLDPQVLGPLFRFNREYYTFDDKGRPAGYRNLDKLRDRVRPLILRRRKADVETELPSRTDRNLFVPLTTAMRQEYAGYEKNVGELLARAKRRPLTPKEQDLLMILLNMMRMICDTPGILKGAKTRDCPKLDELGRVLDESLSDPDVKVIIFSEWTGMLERVREWAETNGVGFAWHTGAVPQKRRRAEILAFRNDPACRLFLSTDSGGVGLNLQNASVVVNCDLPWNPAKLEQRIARAWRKNQRRPVTVVNLIAENTIEHGMLASLAQKSGLAEGILDGKGILGGIQLRRGRDLLLKRLEQVMVSVPPGPAEAAPPSDPAQHFARRAKAALGARLVHCDETWLPDRDQPVLLAVLARGADGAAQTLRELSANTPWRGDAPVLQVLPVEAWDALRAMAAAGMITIHTRATRPLLGEDGKPAPPPLTAEQIARITALRALAEKRRRAARTLDAEGLAEEAAALLRAAEAAEAEAAGIEGGRPAAG